MIKTVITPEMAGADMRARIGRGQRLGILFGRERWGLDNDEVALADVIVSAPVNPAFASLNIAQAVLLVGYEWYKVEAASIGQGNAELPAIAAPGLRAPDTRSATKDELDGFFRHLEEELDQAGFYKTPEKKPGMVPQHAQPVPARRAHRAGSALAARHGGEPEPRAICDRSGRADGGLAHSRLRLRHGRADRRRRIRAELPAAELVYAADNAAFPYGAWREEALVARIETWWPADREVEPDPW